MSSSKEIVKKGMSIIETYDLNLKEIEIIIQEIEKNSQIITQDVLIDSANKDEVFFDEGESLVIKGDYLKKVEQKNKEIEEFDLLFSILSVKAQDGNHYQLLSLDKNNNIYLNFRLLKKLTFNEYYYTYLYNLKHEQYQISNILNFLFRGLIPYAEEYFKQQYSSTFEQYPIFRKIEILLLLFESTNGSFGTLTDRVFVYYLNKYKTFEKLKTDLENLNKKIYSRESGNLLLLKESLPVKNKVPFKLKTAISSSIEELNKVGFSYYQSIVFNSFEFSNEYVLGLAGSGKTHMSSIVAKIFLLFKAVWFANTRKGLPIEYLSYSKESVQKSFLPKIGKLGIYFEKNSDLTIAFMNEILSGIENSYFTDEDFKRLEELDAFFRNKSDILNAIKKLFEEDEKYTKDFNSLLRKIEIQAFLRVIKTLSETQENMTLLNKIKMIFFRLLSKKEFGEAVNFSKKILSILKRFEDVDIKELRKVDYLEIEKVLNKYRDIYSQKMNLHRKAVKELEEEENLEKVVTIDVDQINFNDLFFYVKNMFRLLADSEIEKIKSSLQKLVHKNDEPILDEDYDNINKVIPVLAMPIEEVFNIPVTQKSFLTLIDEALLINQFLYYSIFSRSLISYSFGDINQMDLNFLYNKSSLFEKIKKLYIDNNIKEQDIILKKNLFLNEKYNVSSIWDAIFKMSPNINLLIDNFRNIRYLVYTLIRTNPTYVTYIKQFVSKNKNILDKRIVEKIERAETIDDMIEIVNIYNNEIIKFKDFEGNETEIPLILFDSSSYKDRIELFKKFFEFISIQEFEISDLLIVSVFKQDSVVLKKDIDIVLNNLNSSLNIPRVDVFPANKIQALEYDIVVLLLEDSNSRNYLIENDKLLNVIISRAKKGFIVVCDVNVCMESVMKDIFIDNNFQLIKG